MRFFAFAQMTAFCKNAEGIRVGLRRSRKPTLIPHHNSLIISNEVRNLDLMSVVKI